MLSVKLKANAFEIDSMLSNHQKDPLTEQIDTLTKFKTVMTELEEIIKVSFSLKRDTMT